MLRFTKLRKDSEIDDVWAQLSLPDYETLVLFYCSFVALKRQELDPGKSVIPPEAAIALMEVCELQSKELVPVKVSGGERAVMPGVMPGAFPGVGITLPAYSSVPPPTILVEGDQLLYSGAVLINNTSFALRLYHDLCSGVVRLEVSDIELETPLWNAFVTRYAVRRDEHWAELVQGRDSSRRVVSIAALRKVYVFDWDARGCTPQVERDGGWWIVFEEEEDARQFVECWIGVCRSVE
ncbi:hypothetical protein K470DRAFT_261873 [Piedraia hortae CBS 480.64]|uniref:Uncharacterized protein n=1 Tax=Piedraia hortae CBS 480.64 TaxID=1314780 RepID=A0A6A7CA76_9PEZI|nr:hypothetical protein K470DRAFT_261873 [Piedraia hortae CBS 480.64]